MRILMLLSLACSISCTGPDKNKAVPIIPQPVSLTRESGFFRLMGALNVISENPEVKPVAEVFAVEVSDFIPVTFSEQRGKGLEIRVEPGKQGEGYRMDITSESIVLVSGTLHGIFNGLQSLRQLIISGNSKNGTILIPCCSISDEPRYSWRGIMLDESRHFFGIEKVKQILDIMALHKLNSFHWHLTDVAGWRLEVKKFPLLGTIGGIGNHTDAKAPAAFYTREQVKEIVRYASDRFIQIIPEIDMPGHAGSSNRAYPEYSGGGSEAYPEFTFNPGSDATYGYLTDILSETASLFPAEYIHLGGDEVNFGNQQWNTMPEIKSLMRKNNLEDLKAVERYFVKRMSDSISSLGKITIGWDEIAGFSLDPSRAVVMWWRHDKPGQLVTALEGNYRVIMCPRIPLYFDFVQDSSCKTGRRWRGAYCPLETVYNFPPDSLTVLQEHNSQVMGMQANIWTEMIGDNKRLDYMTYPRISALAEAAWTPAGQKNYNSFLERLKPVLAYFSSKGIYYFNPFDPAQSPEPAGPVKKKYPE